MISFEQILQVALKHKASDIHITAGMPPSLRTSGDIIPLKIPPLNPNDTRKIVYSILTDKQKASFEEKKDFDFSFGIKDLARCRGNIFFQRDSISAVFRILPNKIPELKTLGLPSEILDLSTYKSGLILITGKTGSGKTTTIASLIQALSEGARKHVVTLEDPIEYTFAHSKSIFNQREIGADTLDLDNAMKSILRQDADICLLGELRDKNSIETALRLSETGHLVFATLHTSSAVGSVQRILGVFPPEEQQRIQIQLSMCTNMVLSQQLIQNLKGSLSLASEVLRFTPNIQTLVRDGKLHQIYSAMQMGQASTGMLTMNQSLLQLFKNNIIEVQAAIANSTKPEEILQTLKKWRVAS